MRVAVIMPTLLSSDLRVGTEARALLGAGFEVGELCAGQKPPFKYEPGVDVERVDWPLPLVKLCNLVLKITSYRRHPIWSRRIRRMIGRGDFDIVHAVELRPFFIAARVARKKGIPVVLDLREDYPEMEKGAYRRLSSRLFNSIEKIERIQRDACAAADLVLVTTPMFIDVLSERYPEVPREKFVLVGNYADVASIEAIMATDGEVKEGDTFTITYVGSVGTPERGLQVTIEAMPRIRRSIPGAKLLIVGDGGYLPMLRKQVADLGLDDVVEFRGWVDFTEVPGIIQRSTVCTVPSLNVSYECEMTLPHKLFQYMLLSRPVVVGDCHELMRVVEGSGAGLAFKAGDAADFAEKVISLKDPDLRRSMGRKGREAVLNEYNFTASARRLVELFRELGAEKPD